MSQTFIVLSADPVATNDDVSSTSITIIGASCALNDLIICPAFKFQILIVKLLLALTSLVPSGVTTNVVIISPSYNKSIDQLIKLNKKKY